MTGCTDKFERQFQDGRDASNVPASPEQLEENYLKSDICRRENENRDQYKQELASSNDAEEFKEAVREDKHKGVSKKSNLTVSFPKQVYALWIRQLNMLFGDKFDIFVSYFTALTVSLIAGSLFYQLPVTAAGAFTRGGVLFIALLFNSLTAFSELPTQMGGRPILYRQTGFCFYRPSALSIAQLAADFPIGAPRIAMFCIVVYFMAGLYVSAGAFFTFFINILVSYYAFRALFALFGTICKNYDVAARLAAVIIVSLVLYAGYVIPRDAQARWLFWISYINPVYYGFEALMVNEFKQLSLACVDTYITPRGTGYPTNIGPNQVCTLAGSTAGSQFVSGLAYLDASFGFERKHLWLNFGIQLIFFFGLTAVTCIAIEFLQMGSFASSLTINKKPNSEEKKLDARLLARRDGSEAKEDDGKIDVYGRAFTWNKLKYTVPVSGGERLLLDEVYGFVKPGTLTALMGASGAGKTTLLDVLADRKSIGKIEGDRLVEGKPVGLDFQRGCGYAEQQDIHEHTATVREALRFSAYLRQPSEVSIEEKNAYVEDIIELLEMQDISNAQIGNTGFGLGVADRKRVTIAVELAAKPDQLLFLDEPTSGLDGQGAYTIVRLLKKLAANGQTILCTIHQPNSLLFEQFDRLLLLERGGKTVYFGPVGHDSCHLVKYFKENGAECPEAVNPAEFMLDAVGAGIAKRIGPRDWADIYLDSQLFADNLKTIEEIDAAGSGDADRGKVKEYSTSFMYQLKTVLERTLKSSWRQPDYQFTRMFQHVAIALLTGLLFLQLGNSVATLQYRIFALFIVSVIPAIIIAQIEPYYIMARGTYIRESTSKMYHPVVFSLSQTISELPYAVLCSILYFVIFYYLAGFNYNSNRSGYFFAMFLCVEIFAITLGQAVAALNPSVYLASVWNPLLILIFSLFCGVTIPRPSMTYFWREWMYWLDPFTYVISGLTVNELHDLTVTCEQSELSIFTPPAGQTCDAYAGPFVNSSGGYLVDQANGDCGYCQYANGDEYFATLEIKFSERGRDIGIVIAFICFNIFVTNVASRFMKFANR
jgi:ATP-binding cassette subfamily G (WHITE) protein 2 (SNQ2)